jgi:hypothetical protein
MCSLCFYVHSDNKRLNKQKERCGLRLLKFTPIRIRAKGPFGRALGEAVFGGALPNASKKTAPA